MQEEMQRRQNVSAIISGDGIIDLILVHGIAANKNTWSDVVNILVKHSTFRIHQVDLLGHGSESDVKLNVITLEDQAKFLDKYILENTSGRSVIVGHSYGGLVALLMQLQYPSALRKIVLINSPIFGGDLPLFVRYFRHPGLARVLDLFLSTEARVRFSLARLYARQDRIKLETVQNYVGLLNNSTIASGIEKAASGIDSAALRRYVSRFGEICGVIGFIRSTEDIVTEPGILQMIRHSFPSAKVISIERCGHNIQEECPDETAKAIISIASGVLE